eukprot:7226557-Ditylum_brightwellii.AAC.1
MDQIVGKDPAYRENRQVVLSTQIKNAQRAQNFIDNVLSYLYKDYTKKEQLFLEYPGPVQKSRQ